MTHKDLPVHAFTDQQEFYGWLSQNHDKVPAFWLRYFKKHSLKPTIKHDEAVNVALCWGWIDGLLNKFDDESYVVRFTPRRPKSVWSQVNVGKVQTLIEKGLMTPFGLKHVESAQADGRWAAAYASSSTMAMPEEFMKLLEGHPKALSEYNKLTKAQKYALYWPIATAKTPMARQKLYDTYIHKLET